MPCSDGLRSARGATGACTSCENGGVARQADGLCECRPGFSGERCEVLLWSSDCVAGETDDDLDPDTPCISCGPGTTAPAGSAGPCALCPAGTTDHDYRSSTPCEACPEGMVSTAGAVGVCKDAPAELPVCQNGGMPKGRPAVARSCTDYWLDGVRTDGVYTVLPNAEEDAFEVMCQFSDEGAWTLVSSSMGEPPQDAATFLPTQLDTLTPSSAMADVYKGFIPLVEEAAGLSDIRFTCGRGALDNMLVDLAFHDVDYYAARLNDRFDADNSWSSLESSGSPSRTNALTSEHAERCKAYKTSFYAESSTSDFVFDYEDGGSRTSNLAGSTFLCVGVSRPVMRMLLTLKLRLSNSNLGLPLQPFVLRRLLG